MMHMQDANYIAKVLTNGYLNNFKEIPRLENPHPNNPTTHTHGEALFR
jgi:hypothetical protein